MQLVSFDAFRCAGIPEAVFVKPESVFTQAELVKAADWVLFPEIWQVNFLAYAWKKKLFPSINSYHITRDKVEMTRVLQALIPKNIPNTFIAANTLGIRDKILERFAFPFVGKEATGIMGKGVFLIASTRELDDYLKRNKVVYIQEYLPNRRDLKIIYVGDGAVCSYWRIPREDSIRSDINQGSFFDFSTVPKGIITFVERLAETLGINHASFDLAVVEDQVFVFEFNVLFGNQPLLAADISMANIILKYLKKQN